MHESWYQVNRIDNIWPCICYADELAKLLYIFASTLVASSFSCIFLVYYKWSLDWLVVAHLKILQYFFKIFFSRNKYFFLWLTYLNRKKIFYKTQINHFILFHHGIFKFLHHYWISPDITYVIYIKTNSEKLCTFFLCIMTAHSWLFWNLFF